jgi:hypothetical protein
MVELDDAMRRALLAREDPPSDAREAILASLRTRLGGPSDPGSDDSDPGEPGDLASGPGQATASGQLAWAAKVAAATVALTTGGLLTLKLGALAIAAVTGDEAPRAAPIEVVEPQARVDWQEPNEQTSPPPPEPDVEPPINLAATPDPPASADEPSDASESTLAAELELVRAAKQARAKDPEAALAQLELHRERFAKGVLAPEREALRIELLCELDRRSEADAARERFLVDFPGSPLRARVIASCSNVGTDSNASGDGSR